MIKLEVGQNVKCRNGLEGVVIDYFAFNDEDTQPFKVLLNGQKDAAWYTEDGYYFSTKDNHKWDIVKILKEEEEPMETKEIKVRYFGYENLMFIQNVKESSILILDTWETKVVSVIDYDTPIKAKEQMYTYATVLDVEEVKSH